MRSARRVRLAVLALSLSAVVLLAGAEAASADTIWNGAGSNAVAAQP